MLVVECFSVTFFVILPPASLSSFALEEVKNCVFDSIVIHDGGTVDAPLLFGPECGTEIQLQGNRSTK